MLSTIKTFASLLAAKCKKCHAATFVMAMVMVMTALMSVPAFATGGVDINATFTSIMNILYDIAKYMGIGIVAYAVFSWILSMKDDNADGQSRAIRFLVVGIVLAGLGTIAAPIINNLLGI